LNLMRLDKLYEQSGAQLHPALVPRTGVGQKTDNGQPLRVLFLCTQNRVRSQMAEGILRYLSEGKAVVLSAGVRPGIVHPLAVQALADLGIDITAQRSKHLDEVRDQSFDWVITVCDQVREQCPAFPGSPHSAHWSIADPIAAAESTGDEDARRAIFAATAQELSTRIHYLLLAEGQPGSSRGLG
jgi:ArsR family transcriptional regulator, arsenate/arsenite/antimonite-responsive transcriptional repressor / arsenate reductase (thioredoxin)